MHMPCHKIRECQSTQIEDLHPSISLCLQLWQTLRQYHLLEGMMSTACPKWYNLVRFTSSLIFSSNSLMHTNIASKSLLWQCETIYITLTYIN